MSTIRNFNFISSNYTISFNSFYKEILGNFAYDVEYILLINYSNKIDFEHEECVVFTLKSSDINSSILKLHAYLSDSTAEHNVIYEDLDNRILFEDGNHLYVGITDVTIKYYNVNKHIY